MAATPPFKVYKGAEYIAAFKHADNAAAFVAVIGEDATVRYGHNTILWREGAEAFSASESYDGAADIMLGRMKRRN
jgi:hypothetical protein